MSQTNQRALEALDLLEDLESRSLAWGLVDESWTHDQICEVLRERWPDRDAEVTVDTLIAASLLVQLPREWPNRYRTRMAESVRLFTRLRQLFPRRPWQAGAPLVSDFRFLRRSRSFPRRDIAPAAVLDTLREQALAEPVLAEVSRVLGQRELASFQVQATAAVLSALERDDDAGIVVGAGTGSGKTLAFYLPAMAALSASTSHRVVAIYPRNELLKDQFATAVQEARRLQQSGGRALTVGAYFGPTPNSERWEPDPRSGWRRSGKDWICPFLTCPAEIDRRTCGQPMLWRRPTPSSTTGWGFLVCGTCGGRVTSDEITLTRSAMRDNPPDILFTTTEMLNQQMSDGWTRHVFGLGPRASRRPSMVLLDEIHTYSGTSGAQAAFLLRRWRRLLGRSVTWVGLSATLSNAQTFFADLCGLRQEDVTDIRPAENDLRRHGSEYQLLLRGDPASQTALLSTSIQSLMLLRRVLNETGSPLDEPYGTKVFAFVENLDLVNRLYRQLLSAEGRNPIGRRDQRLDVLAGLRIPIYAESRIVIDDPVEWDENGQHWWLSERLGFSDRSLVVSRTSSQDSGVDAGADIVVATSSLEVGYDDPRVGGVLQHKAPRDVAQFLQRRGRAGRVQSQRPWTVVVLSDYGRDRLAFQDYETLLDPIVPAKRLPLGNRSVRKMQAAMCLIDWLALRLNVSGHYRWSTRRVLVQPSQDQQQQVDACTALLKEVIDGGAARQDLLSFVGTSLGLAPDAVAILCWEHPRSLLLEVVPTAYRRLLSRWSTTQRGVAREGTDISGRQPLPEFIPPTLFSDLELPEVDIEPPQNYDQAADTSIAVAVALGELAPGRVTLRWAVQKVRGLWIEPGSAGVLELSDGLAAEAEILTSVPGLDNTAVPLVRPRTIRPTVPPPEVRPQSSGRLRWRLLVDSETGGISVPRPRNSALGELLPQMSAHLSVGTGPLTMWRYALDAESEVVRQTGRERQTITFTHDSQPAAVGFETRVDAISVEVHVPAWKESVLSDDPVRLRQLRSDRFLYCCQERLAQQQVGPFLAGWVAEVSLAAASRSILDGIGIDSLATIGDAAWRSLAESVVDAVLVSLPRATDDEVPLRQDVIDVFANATHLHAVREALPVLGQAPNSNWMPWIRARFLQTMAAALHAASQQLCPDFNVDLDMLVDVVDDGDKSATVLLSDTVPGGGGLVENLTRRIADDPRRFDRLVASAVEPSDVEEVDLSLRRTLTLLDVNSTVGTAAAEFRSASGGRLDTWQKLLGVLRDEGVALPHAAVSGLSTRIFRPGSGAASDALIRALLKRWDEIDEAVGFAVDHRVACFFLASENEIQNLLSRIRSASTGSPEEHVHSVLQSLLWVRGVARRAEALRTGNKFVLNPPRTERTLVRGVLPSGSGEVDVESLEWRDRLTEVLRVWGEARLASATGDGKSLAEAVRQICTVPLEIDWLLVYPQIAGVLRDNGRTVILLKLREAAQ
ncbi:protein DpdJ [Actinoplanes palleronii]|uniref:DEAD/DEAH box helicase n=1 Tax=Actinoplanes palleronii TaxID=113570 RepID=A0ABQ4B1K2_9ACTN|nr:protein DpdJ [Actinoplanes palleronii]GIE64545.1 hypothetical protein Apa02nite_006530 [Actinoplanes palleronii]